MIINCKEDLEKVLQSNIYRIKQQLLLTALDDIKRFELINNIKFQELTLEFIQNIGRCKL